ncbi:Lrp/AsnC family transcriptional regulator [Yinghuangia sp. YIM S09857]|uniref:Lrp/AsnC family transcriptional regulator n=1 Tax=Yinghuangia sp. YIM S09857 TaxID=3436929 RepID=UPI003F52F520
MESDAINGLGSINVLDVLDVKLMHALQVDGRAPFARIAEVLGVSDRTVARRYGRLSTAGTARVVGVASSDRLGRAEWLARLRVLPGNAASVAHALARRPDTAWVTVAGGGTEIVCIIRVTGEQPLPADAFGRDWPFTRVDVHRLLRPAMRQRRWRGRTSALTDDEVAALLGPVASHDTANGAPVPLSSLDRRLLDALAVDGRAAYPELARRVGWSETAVRRRLDHLRRSQVLHFDVEVEPRLFGGAVQCLLWINAAPAHTRRLVQAVASDDEAAFVATTTGPHNVFAIAVCRDAAALDTYLADRIGSLPGVHSIATTTVNAYAKRAAPTPIPHLRREPNAAFNQGQ